MQFYSLPPHPVGGRTPECAMHLFIHKGTAERLAATAMARLFNGLLLSLWAGVTYTVPRRATINAPPPMGPLGRLMGDPGASFSKYPRGGLTLIPNPSYMLLALGGMG